MIFEYIDIIVSCITENLDIINSIHKQCLSRTPLILATMQDRPDIVYTLLSLDCDMNHFDTFNKNALMYAKRDSECEKILRGVYDPPQGGKRVLEYRPSAKNAAVGVVNVGQHETQKNARVESQPANNKNNGQQQQEGPFNLNPKMADPEYRKHITNLFLASKFKTDQQQ